MRLLSLIFFCLSAICCLVAGTQTANVQESEIAPADSFSMLLHSKADYYIDQYQLRRYISDGPYLVLGSKPHDHDYFSDLTIVTKTSSQYIIATKWYSRKDVYCDSIALDNQDLAKLFCVPCRVQYYTDIESDMWPGYSYYIALYDEDHNLIYEVNRYRKLLDPITNEPDNTYFGKYYDLLSFYIIPRMQLVN